MAKPVIVLIDDEKTVLDSLIVQLKTHLGSQYAFEASEDVDEAWEIINDLHTKNTPVVLIISDWLMPKQKGDQFLIDVYNKYPKIAQIMLSGFADEESVRRTKEYANLKAFFAKPWDEAAFLEAVQTVLATNQ